MHGEHPDAIDVRLAHEHQTGFERHVADVVLLCDNEGSVLEVLVEVLFIEACVREGEEVEVVGGELGAGEVACACTELSIWRVPGVDMDAELVCVPLSSSLTGRVGSSFL